MNFFISQHADERMIERDVSVNDVVAAIRAVGAGQLKAEKNTHGREGWKVFFKVADLNDTLVVVFDKNNRGAGFALLTVFWKSGHKAGNVDTSAARARNISI